MMLRISFVKSLFGFQWIFVLGEYLEDKRSPATAGLFVLYRKATRGSVQLTDTNIRLRSSDKSREII